jgi:hypothetical protein
MKFRVFWDVAPCIHDVQRRFKGAYCLHHQGDSFFVLMMEAVRTSETSFNFNVTTRRYIPEKSKLHTYRHENLKSHIIINTFPKMRQNPVKDLWQFLEDEDSRDI